MKKTMRNAWRVLMVLAVAFTVAGCADGELATSASPSITPPAPMIIKFAADPVSVKSGESTSIMWEVAGADEVEITAVSSTGEAVDFNVQTEDLAGEASVALTSTTDFVLTATKSAENLESEEEEAGDEALLSKSGQIQFGPEPVEEEPMPSEAPAISSVSQTITVTVSDVADISASIDADKPVVSFGEQTVIRWTVSPAENVSVVVVADSGEAFSPTDQCGGSITEILGQPAADPVPTVGCAVVAPSQRTTYTVTATDSSGNSATDSTVVDVEGDVDAKIQAAKDDSSPAQDNLLQVESYQDPVIISWEVSPEAANVTVSATPSAVCTPEFPVDAEGQTTGSASCEITGETKFKIVATLGSESDEDEVVVVAAGGNAGLVIADQWAFEDENISMEMKLTTQSNPTSVAKVLINSVPIDTSLVEQLKTGSKIVVPDVVATLPNVEVKLLDSSDSELYSTKTVQVIKLLVDGLNDNEVAVSSIEFDDEGVRYYGVQLDGYNDGVARMYVQKMSDVSASAKEFDFGNPIKDLYNMQEMWNNAFFKNLETYPVSVAIREEKPEHVFAGTTGALMWSQDGGENFREILIMRVRSGPAIKAPPLPGAKLGDHVTCGRADYGDFGGPKIQTGTKPRFVGDIISLNQMCDVHVSKKGRVIVATDFGVWTEADLDDHLENSNFFWEGTPPDGSSQTQVEDDGYWTYGKVVNALAVVENDDGDVERVFAGTTTAVSADGEPILSGEVYVSENGGVSWQQYGSLMSPVYALTYDARNKRLYAGTEEGVATSSSEDAGWSYRGAAEPVISIAVDPASPLTKMTIMAGMPTGAKISRDGGETWSPLELKGGAQEVGAMAITAKKVGGNVHYSISLGSNKGQLIQEPVVGAMTVGDVRVAAD